MTKLAKTKGKTGPATPVLTDAHVYEDGKPVGHIVLSGDAAEGAFNGK